MKWNVNKLIHNKYRSIVTTFGDNDPGSALMLLWGRPGSGKTRAALEYCKRNPSSLYFSFKGFTKDMALRVFSVTYPKVFTSPCASWQEFFNALYEYAKRRTPVIFFDDVGERNDKEDFFERLQELCDKLLEEKLGLVVLTREPWDLLMPSFVEGFMPAVSPPELSRFLPGWTTEDIFRLYSFTMGNYALVSEAEGTASFADYLERICSDPCSAFMTLTPSWLNKVFRSPEAYHSILHCLAYDLQRITELSEHTGFPKNKCEKYLGALIEAGLVKKYKPEGRRPSYLLLMAYNKAWYRYVYPSMNNTKGLAEQLARFVEDTALPMALHWEVIDWIESKAFLVMHSAYFTIDPECEFVRINNVCFDYFGYTGHETMVAVAKVRFDDADWEEIERAIESRVMFYDAKIILCSIHQFSRFYWELNREYENIRLVQLKSMG